MAPANPRWTAKLWNFSRYIAGIVCISLLAFGLAGPPWPHLALLALLLLGTRSHSMLAFALLAAGSVLAALHARGLRLTMHLDDGGRFGVSVVRYGAPIAGLGPGTLLRASDELENSIFRRSVVLIYEHNQFGARGVILNQPLSGPPPDTTRGGPVEGETEGEVNTTTGGAAPHGPLINNRKNKGALKGGGNGGSDEPQGDRSGSGGSGGDLSFSHSAVVLHRLGGPVGMPGEGARQIMAVLHSVEGIGGAPVLKKKGGGKSPVVYQGGRLNDILEGSKESLLSSLSLSLLNGNAVGGGDHKGAIGLREESRKKSGNSYGKERDSRKGQKKGCSDVGDDVSPVFVFHGIATWGEGQLEGEIRAKAWAYGDAEYNDLIHAVPAEQWDGLVRSDRMTIMA